MSHDHTLPVFAPPANFMQQAAVSGMDAYHALVKHAEDDYEGFWATQAKRLLHWQTPFTKKLNQDKAPFFTWFEDGRLNASYNCLDRNVERGLGDKTAIIFEADGGEVTRTTYSQLL
ncbi:MAG: acetyl-coenzyme A synthetase, partial [Burkholderiales bacterium]|nr:acetyl-coenzyme A synthetase [Burkholderiales bacterium]